MKPPWTVGDPITGKPIIDPEPEFTPETIQLTAEEAKNWTPQALCDYLNERNLVQLHSITNKQPVKPRWANKGGYSPHHWQR